MISPPIVRTCPGFSVWPSITNCEAEFSKKVDEPMTMNGVVVGIVIAVIMPAGETVLELMASVAPLMITDDPEVGRTKVVGPPGPVTVRVPPGVRVELPITKFDAAFAVYVELPTVKAGAVVGTMAGEPPDTTVVGVMI